MVESKSNNLKFLFLKKLKFTLKSELFDLDPTITNTSNVGRS